MIDAKKPGGYFDKRGEEQKPVTEKFRKGFDEINWKKKPKPRCNHHRLTKKCTECKKSVNDTTNLTSTEKGK